MVEQIGRRARKLSGIPALPDAGRLWWIRFLRSPLTWVTVVALAVYALCLLDQYLMLSPDRTLPDGKVALGLNGEALLSSAWWAMWTLFAWVFLFLWLDRWRPQRPLIWLLVLGWGASVSTWVSIYINTWAGDMMSVQGQAVDTGARPAIFIAPFVEEAAKATVLFLLAMLVRYQLVSKLNLVALAGLSGVGFAFTENIIYYARAFVYATSNIEVTDPNAAVMSLVMLRGVNSSFGHPLFTAMTALGLVVGLRARSKIVRVVAPLAGFLVAAFGHMLFNGLATVGAGFFYSPIPIIVALVVFLAFLVFGTVREGRLIASRLGDLIAMGWLEPRDPIVFSRFWKRTKLAVASVFRGPRAFMATLRFMRSITELAYLRDARTRGVIDNVGIVREKELLHRLRDLRGVALTETEGLKTFIWPFKRRRRRALPPPHYPGPAGLAGQWPAP